MFGIHSAARAARSSLLSAAVAGVGLAGLLGLAPSAAHAASNQVSGFVTVDSCGALSGKITYAPGLISNTARATNATMTGFISNCSNQAGLGAGFGKVTMNLSGNASLAANSYSSGTFTINWPTPATVASTGTVSVVDSGGVEQLSGTVTSGPFTGAVIGMNYLPTSQKGNGTAVLPVTSQTFINTTSLTVSENTG
jgi:hypothetical protein